MKKLFRVSFKGQDFFFDDKMKAKFFGRENGLKGIIVHRGPDHNLGQTDGTSSNTPSTKKKGW
jgi:hypothetical protein